MTQGQIRWREHYRRPEHTYEGTDTHACMHAPHTHTMHKNRLQLLYSKPFHPHNFVRFTGEETEAHGGCEIAGYHRAQECGHSRMLNVSGLAPEPGFRADTWLHLDLSAHTDLSTFWFCKRCTFTKEIRNSGRHMSFPGHLLNYLLNTNTQSH